MAHDRRTFLKESVQGLAACCVLSQCPGLLRAESEEETLMEIDTYIGKVAEEKTYCAYRCTKKCPILVASLKGDQKFLKEQAEKWSKDHDGEKIPEGQMFCFGCNPADKPLGFIVTRCTVRKCAMEKGLSSCVACENLADCDHELWKKYPQHHKHVIALQKAG